MRSSYFQPASQRSVRPGNARSREPCWTVVWIVIIRRDHLSMQRAARTRGEAGEGDGGVLLRRQLNTFWILGSYCFFSAVCPFDQAAPHPST